MRTSVEVKDGVSLLLVHRVAAGLSQDALAARSGLRRETISRFETGYFKNPSLKTCFALAEGLGVEVWALFPDCYWDPARPPGSKAEQWENEHARDLAERYSDRLTH